MSSPSRAKSRVQAAPAGALSLRDITSTTHREADADFQREKAEQVELSGRRWRRKSGRTEIISMRTLPEIKETIIKMAEDKKTDIVRVIEDAIETRYSSKG